MNVHVIILNWKGWKDTLPCIQSVQALPERPTIVVVDNASGDESVARIREAHPDVHLIESASNLGFSGGNNLGIRWALEQGAEYVWLLNNDTEVKSDTLTAMLEESQRHQNRAVVGSRLYYHSDPQQLQAWGGGTVNFTTGRSEHVQIPLADLDYIIGASMLIPRTVLETVGLLDDGFFLYWEDTDFCFRARKAGFVLTVAEGSVVLHKESASLGKRSAALDFYFSQSALRFFRKHAPRPWLPILIGMVSRTGRRVLQRDWPRIKAVWQPLLEDRKKA